MRASASSGSHVLNRTSIWRWVGVAISPFLLTVVVITVFAMTVGPAPFPRAPTAVYATMSLVVVLVLVWWLPPPVRSDLIPYRIPSGREVGVSIAVAVVAIGVVDPIATVVGSTLGAEATSASSFDTAPGAVIFSLSAMTIGPITEEVLFRGPVLDGLQVRYGALAAIVGSSLAFGGIHLFMGGVSGIVGAFLAGILYAGMRVQFSNLTGATLAHGLNNAYWVAVALGVIPNVVPG